VKFVTFTNTFFHNLPQWTGDLRQSIIFQMTARKQPLLRLLWLLRRWSVIGDIIASSRCARLVVLQDLFLCTVYKLLAIKVRNYKRR